MLAAYYVYAAFLYFLLYRHSFCMRMRGRPRADGLRFARVFLRRQPIRDKFRARRGRRVRALSRLCADSFKALPRA